MIPYHVYKVLHLTGVFMVVMALAAMALHFANGGSRQHGFRKIVAATHGFGMIISLVGGFGLLARLGFVHNAIPPGWALAKLGIWIIFGGLTSALIRRPQSARPIWFLIIALTGVAAYLANYKPF